MPKQGKYEFYEDTPDEGRRKYYLDVDRMINEGLSGGNVCTDPLTKSTTIGETNELTKEEPPFKIT